MSSGRLRTILATFLVALASGAAVYAFLAFLYYYDSWGIMATGLGGLIVYFVLLLLVPLALTILVVWMLLGGNDSQAGPLLVGSIAPVLLGFVYSGVGYFLDAGPRFAILKHGVQKWETSTRVNPAFRGLVVLTGSRVDADRTVRVTERTSGGKYSSPGTRERLLFPIVREGTVAGFVYSWFGADSVVRAGWQGGAPAAGLLEDCPAGIPAAAAGQMPGRSFAHDIVCLKYLGADEANVRRFTSKAWPIVYWIAGLHGAAIALVTLVWVAAGLREKE